MTIEKRRFPRRPGNHRAAAIYLTAGAAPIMCTVHDISEGGAGLTFVDIAVAPDVFRIEIKGETQMRRCRVVWRQAPHRMGVAFD